MRKLETLDYEVKIGEIYEKSLNIPKISVYYSDSESKIFELLNDPNNVFPEEYDPRRLNNISQVPIIAVYFDLGDFGKKIDWILLNESEPLFGVGFQFDQIKVKTITGGYPGRGQFSVKNEEVYPIIRMNEIKKRVKGYGFTEIEVIKSNRFVYIYDKKQVSKNNTILICFLDGSRIRIYF
ncbi:hypothetical protein [Leptospira ellisii]|uniref:hypothetical protein n=1 Tax=Leptospira ellisii TaxID=2023197 RepID=UPI000C2A4493|nr:hypothetical protein [Leptospira ellisii]PKA04270.1 hypothetical protein CH375_12010 [Leptospira ellisii]